MLLDFQLERWEWAGLNRELSLRCRHGGSVFHGLPLKSLFHSLCGLKLSYKLWLNHSRLTFPWPNTGFVLSTESISGSVVWQEWRVRSPGLHTPALGAGMLGPAGCASTRWIKEVILAAPAAFLSLNALASKIFQSYLPVQLLSLLLFISVLLMPQLHY